MMAPAHRPNCTASLKPTGSIYLHCDPTASHYLKLLMDAVFWQTGNFCNEIIWPLSKNGPTGKIYVSSANHGRDTLLLAFPQTRSSQVQSNFTWKRGSVNLENDSANAKNRNPGMTPQGPNAYRRRWNPRESAGVRQDDVWENFARSAD